jgi:sorting nexin-1/2
MPRDENGIRPVFVITVDDPQKVGDPIRSFTMYTVHTQVRANILNLLSFILTAVSADNVTVISKILLLCSPTLLGFPMAIRNSFYQQPRGCGSTSSREESFRTV